jgi:hypothetical protein
LERLAKYILRPPICLDRLEVQPDGRLSYKLKTKWRDGTTHVLMERHELLERLAPLIPPPRAHQVRYHGILAPCASGRDRVVPGPRRETSAALAGDEGNRRAACTIDRSRMCPPPDRETSPTVPISEPEGPHRARTEADSGASPHTKADPIRGPAQPAGPLHAPSARPRSLRWADLLHRVFGIEALRCECGKTIRVIAAMTEPTVAKRTLDCMGLPPRAPPLTPACMSGSAADPWPEEAGAAAFDQAPPAEWTEGA